MAAWLCPADQHAWCGGSAVIGDEMRALRRLQREQEPRSPFVFTSERGSPFTTAGFARMLERAGEAAGLALAGSPAHAPGTPVALRWRTRATIRGRCRPISGTGISSTPCAILSCRRIGLRTSGGSGTVCRARWRSWRVSFDFGYTP